jgi:hypothetical protein
MKKLLLLVLGSVWVGSMAFGQTTQVLSRNAVGYVKVDVLSNNLALATLNFNAFDNKISAVFTNQLTGGGNFNISDNVLKWDPFNKTYIIFWKTTGGEWRQFPQAVLTTNRLKPGETFWIKNNHNTNQTVYLMGEVPDRITALTQEVDVVSNLNFVAYSYPSEIAITNLNLPQAKSGGNFNTADNILKWNPITKTYTIFWRAAGGWREFPQTTSTVAKILPGDGFWYKRLSTNFVWSEVKPYTWP